MRVLLDHEIDKTFGHLFHFKKDVYIATMVPLKKCNKRSIIKKIKFKRNRDIIVVI